MGSCGIYQYTLVRNLEFEVQRWTHWAALMDATCCFECVGYNCSKHYMYRCTLEIWALIGQGLKGNSVMVMQDSFIVSQNLMTLISTNLLLNSTLGISQILVIVLKNHSYEICSNEIRIRRELPVVGIT